jgi:hypothetical protein
MAPGPISDSYQGPPDGLAIPHESSLPWSIEKRAIEVAVQRAMGIAVLRRLAKIGPFDLRTVGEPMRQKLIELGMAEPPLVDVDADRVFITKAGREALAAYDEQ